MACQVTVLTGTSGAFHYKPAGTKACLSSADFPANGSDLQVGVFLGFQAGDRVTLSYPPGTDFSGEGRGLLTQDNNLIVTFSGQVLATGVSISAGDYYVKTYDPSTGIMTISLSEDGPAEVATARPPDFGGEKATIFFADYQVFLQIREWSLEISRSEIDVSAIGGSYDWRANFRNYTTGFGDGSGTAVVYISEEDGSLADRIIQDVIQRKQIGAFAKFYIDKISSEGVVSDVLSKFVEMPIVLTSASFNVNPDESQSISISFRPSGAPVFDLLGS